MTNEEPLPSSSSSSISSWLKVKSNQNESKYRTMFTELIQKHAGIIQLGNKNSTTTNSNNNDPYQAENKLIEKAVTSERNAILSGIMIGLAAFTSFRYGPVFLVKRLGGEKKARALREAEEASKKDPGQWVKNVFSLSFEAMFGIWAGFRGYNTVSKEMAGGTGSFAFGATDHHGDDSGALTIFDSISKIPLVEGRSKISENVCEEWINISYHQIPRNFWKQVELEKGQAGSSGLRDPRAWRAIADFAINCQKRTAYTKMIQEDKYMQDGSFSTISNNQVELETIAIPAPGVPEDIIIPEDLFLEPSDSNNTDNLNSI